MKNVIAENFEILLKSLSYVIENLFSTYASCTLLVIPKKPFWPETMKVLEDWFTIYV